MQLKDITMTKNNVLESVIREFVNEKSEIPDNVNDKQKYSSAKSYCKSQYKVWPSAHGSGCIVRTYKRRGGTYSESYGDIVSDLHNLRESLLEANCEGNHDDYVNNLGNIVAKGTGLPTMSVSTEDGAYKLYSVSSDGVYESYLTDDDNIVVNKVAESLKQWYGDGKKGNWVDISRKKKGGGHPACGRSKAKKKSKGYPVCRPKSVANKMTSKEKKNATQRKRRAQKKQSGKKPSRIKFKDKNEVPD